MAGERKDISDLKRVLKSMWDRLDRDYLFKRVRESGLEKEFKKIVKRLGIRGW